MEGDIGKVQPTLMSVQIDQTALQKLTHDSIEIRLRSLEQIEAKFARAIANGLGIEFKPIELCKQLIKWFGCKPLHASEKVLEFIGRLLRSHYGEEIVKHLGTAQLRKEIGKVNELLFTHEGIQPIVNEILQLIDSYNQEIEPKVDQQSASDLIDKLGSLNLESVLVDESSGDSRADNNTEYEVPDSAVNTAALDQRDYELTWSRPTVMDYRALKTSADVLADPKAGNYDLQNTLQHLRVTLCDYPAEFVLQPPHVFCKLLELFDRDVGLSVDTDLYGVIEMFLEMLEQRLKIRAKTINFALPSKSQVVYTAKMQLKVDKAMQLLLNKCLTQLDINVQEKSACTIILFKIIKSIFKICTLQHCGIENSLVGKLSRIADIVRNPETYVTVNRIKYLLTICLLHDVATINFKIGSIQEHNMHLYSPLLDLINDFSFQQHYAERFCQIKILLNRLNSDYDKQYKQLKEYEVSFEIAINRLRTHHAEVEKLPQKITKQRNAKELLEDSTKLLPVLNILKSLKLVQMLFKSVIDCNALYEKQPNLKPKGLMLIHRLMQLQTSTLRGYVYQQLADCVKKHFACLMNGENYCVGLKNTQLLGMRIIGVPFDVTIIMEIIYEYHRSTLEEIQENCLSVLLLLLKSQHFFTAEDWMKFLEILLPVAPLLQCLKSPKITEIILNIYDPDEQKLPFIAMLRGNVNLLFQKDSIVRSEALTRLIFTLDSMDQSNEYVPNIKEISDILTHDICIVDPPRDLQRIFSATEALNEVIDLQNLLYLLDGTDLEPLMRKSVLMQLNVICKNWDMTGVLCQQHAHYLILKSLESALQKNSPTDYSDAVIPAVGILAKILCYDTTFRLTISDVPNIYFLLLRSLFLYSHDIQVRQDASVCLFLLLYGSYIVVNGIEGTAEGPQILENIQVPFKCKFLANTTNSQHDAPDTFNNIFTKNAQRIDYVRQVIAHFYCKEKAPTEADFEAMPQELDIDLLLMPTKLDRRLMNSSNMQRNVKNLLKPIANATEHRSLFNAILALHLQFLLNVEAYNTNEGDNGLSPDIVSELHRILKRLVQLPPGNTDDFELFKEVLSLLNFCLQDKSRISQFRPMVIGFATTLRDDFNHGLILLLRNPKIPIDCYANVCKLIEQVLDTTRNLHSINNTNNNNNNEEHINFSILYANLFELSNTLVIEYFELRDLQRVRCLLHLICFVSSIYLEIPGKKLDTYCKSFKKMSISLKSSTQTGAQWHRDCLLTALNIYSQLPNNSSEVLKYSKLGYVSGLCGHADSEVRALAWCCLAQAAHLDESETSDITKGARETVINDLAYLPGGFLACCISTFLDSEETVLVRQMSGNFFVMLLSSYVAMIQSHDDVQTLLINHDFFYEFERALNATCVLGADLPQNYLYNDALMATSNNSESNKYSAQFVSCEIISCFCRICNKFMRMRSDFITNVCAQNFIFKLYELLKTSSTIELMSSNPAYYVMSGDICQLYALCAKSNFDLLQRILCHDEIWLANFSALLNPPFTADETALIKVIQLFLVLCRDDTAYLYFCEQLGKTPETLAKLFHRAFSIKKLNTPLQQCTLAFLSFLLIKAQNESGDTIDGHGNFIKALEAFIEPKSLEFNNDVSENDEGMKKTRCDGSQISKNLRDTESVNSKSTFDVVSLRNSNKSVPVIEGECSIATYACLELFRVFTYLYNAKACKFDAPPSTSKQQVCETLSLLLKSSSIAQNTAGNLKIFNRLLQIFKNFLSEFNTSCTTFVRLFGDRKKMIVISNFELLFNMILNWFSSPTAMMSDELQTAEFCKILIEIWPWLAHSAQLQLLVLRACAFLSNRSFVVCRQFCTLSSCSAHTVMQLITKIIIMETQRLKPSNAQIFPIITYGLRVIMNCCVCAEGRLILIKDHVLDIFDGLYPFNLKSPKMKLEIINAWLQFWELFSRYNEGAQARNLNGLCSIIQNDSRAPPVTRLLALKILRNMCFCNANRSQLLASNDFMCTIDDIVGQKLDLSSENSVSEKVSCEQQFIICVALWRLISGGIKFVSMIRGTKLAKKLKILHEQLQAIQEDDEQVFNSIPFTRELNDVLNIIFGLFQS